jgi:hypothetical protein
MNSGLSRVRSADQHIYHHSAVDGARVNMELERNSRGFNWKITVVDAPSVDAALALIADAKEKIAAQILESDGGAA